jgi:hypothetical protein
MSQDENIKDNLNEEAMAGGELHEAELEKVAGGTELFKPRPSSTTTTTTDTTDTKTTTTSTSEPTRTFDSRLY